MAYIGNILIHYNSVLKKLNFHIKMLNKIPIQDATNYIIMNNAYIH